jgi:GT2 family glycosyltransferase
MPAQDPRVCCVIVNWNGWRDTLDCLASVRQQEYGALDLIVVDNGSTDDSPARIRAGFPDVRLIETRRNLGFAGGTNVGLREGLAGNAEFFWLLNNDTVCPPDTIRKLVRKAQEKPEAGLVGTVLYYADDPTRVQAWGGGRVRWAIGYSTHFLAPAELGPECFVTFASALVRRAVLEEVGLLYEGFFMYYEDSDFSQRMQRMRWRLAVAEDTAVLHKEGGSGGRHESPAQARMRTTAGMRFIERNSGMAWLGMPVFVALRLARRVASREWRSLPAVLAGAWDYLRASVPPSLPEK